MGRLRIVWEMEKPRNLYVRPMDINWGKGRGGNERGREVQGREEKLDNCNTIINKIYLKT